MKTSTQRRVVCAWVGGLVTLALASGSHAEDASSQVEKCSQKLGVLAVAEPQMGWDHLQSYGLGSPASLLRMMVQQSDCFDVVERGVALQNLQQERALAQSGDLREESNVNKGQMQAADFVMTPNVQVSASDTGGIGGYVAGALSRWSSLFGNLKFKEASTSILIADVRSSIQVAAAEGKATKTDFGVGGWTYGSGAWGGLGGYTKTPEGKVVAASLLDNYNEIVKSIRNQPQLIRTHSASGDRNAAQSTHGEAFNAGPAGNAAASHNEASQPAGQLLQPKIGNVKVYAEASRTSKLLGTLQRQDEVVASGEVSNGFAYVDGANASGWVQRSLMAAGSQPGASTPVPLTTALGPMMLGDFAGNYYGADQGSFTVVVIADGSVRGRGRSDRAGDFDLQGRIDGAGNLNLRTAGGFGGGVTVFTGRIDGSSGRLTGDWRYAPGSAMNGTGNFSGARQAR
ncbi:MAG: hypothetical protein JOY60_10180 [Burkholderiaceae bacterium]|nr:hypothetical protein [Burkholderiaceae bacterium]